ncbi:hypothetical protein WG66_014534 [Moniliophthora roreri]|nr:hypothetical protein WG66_014534 [Moniliophthora roreri]
MYLNIPENVAIADGGGGVGGGGGVPNVGTAVYQLAGIIFIWLLSKVDDVKALFSIHPSWPIHIFSATHAYLKIHPFIVLCTTSLVFFGPITFAIPLVVGQDVVVHLVLNVVYLLHGLVSVNTLANYYHSTTNALSFAPPIFRLEPIFAWLEDISSTYNKWTTEWMPLLLLRVLAAAIGVYVLVGMVWLWR